MLSFTKGKPVAIAVDKAGKVVFTIHVTDDEEEPDIKVDTPLELIDDADLTKIRSEMRLGRIELKMLKKGLQCKQHTSSLNLSPKIERALEILEELSLEKLKKEVDFAGDSDIDRVIPLIGARPTPYDRSICLIGPSEAGKTYMVKEICRFDIRRRPVVVFSRIDDDESLRELTTLKSAKDGKSRLVKIPLHSEDQLLSLPTNSDLNGCICLFDDLDSFPKDIGDFLREYRDSILESGRHENISVISTSHVLNNHNKTKVLLNEAELVVLFPAANKRHSASFLKERLGLEKREVDHLIAKAMASGRYLAMRVSAPNMLIHSGGVILL